MQYKLIQKFFYKKKNKKKNSIKTNFPVVELSGVSFDATHRNYHKVAIRICQSSKLTPTALN